MNREVTISIRVDETGSEGAFKRLSARFSELGDVSDKAIRNIGSKLENKLIVGSNAGNREYLETIRRISPELRTLHEQIKAGAFDVTDYNRRMSQLPTFVRSAIEQVKGLGEAFRNTEKEVEHGTNGIGKLLVGLNVMERGVDFIKQKLIEGKDEFLKFGKEISAIDTILDDGLNVEKIRAQIASLPAALGKESELANAFKLAAGSGVEAGKALEFTATSAKAAKAGFAGVTETVDASTTVLNSFGIQSERVNTVYDLMFQTVKSGKIEFPQLAASIGQVSNVAAQSGVKLEEMFAVIATATATTKPSIAIEAFRSALSNVLKPSQEAAKLAEALGLQFNVSALRAKGFAAFLQDVMDKTKGNTDQLAILFGDVQGLNSILSITGAQAKNFSKNLNDMSNASGNVDKAFQKQQQSLSAQLETSGVVFQKYVSNTLTFIEPILKGILSLAANFPNAIMAMTVAVALLTAAHFALNSQMFITASAAIPSLLKNLQNLIGIMMSLRQVTAMSASALTAFTLGWSAVAAVIVIAIYAFSQMETATDRANKVTLDSINANSTSLKTYTDLAAEAKNVAAASDQVSQAQVQNGDIHERLNSILGRLDPVTQAYIKSLVEEKQQVSALTSEIDKNIEVRKATLEATLRTLAEGIIAQRKTMEEESNNIKTLQQNIRETQTLLNTPTSDLTGKQLENLTDARDRIILWSGAIVDAGGRTSDLNIKLAENEVKLIQTAKGLQLSSDQLHEFFTNAGYSQQQVDLLTAAATRTSTSQETFADKTKGTTNALDEQRKAVFDLRLELQKLANYDQEKIDRSIFDIVRLTTTKAEAAALAKKTLENSPDFRKMIEENKAANERAKAVQDVYQPSEVSRTRKSKAPNPAADFRRENRIFSGNAQWDKWVYEAAKQYGIDPMLIFAQMNQESSFKKTAISNKGASGLMQLMPRTARGLGVKNIFDPKQNIEAGVKYLRQQLDNFDGNVALSLAAYNAGPGAVQKYKGIPPYKETQDYVKRISDKYQKLKGGKFEMGAGFDYQRSIAELSDQRTKDYREAQTLSTIEMARMTGNAPDAEVLRDYHRMKVEEAKRQGNIQPEFEDIAKEFKKYQTLGTEVTTRTTLANKRDQRFSDLRESLDLNNRQKDLDERRLYLADEINIRAEDYRLGLQEQLTETQVEAALLAKRNIAIETSVEFEKQRNAQIREIGDIERDLGVLRAQNANAEFVNERRKLAASRERESLERSITDLQDEIANAGVNDALKIQEASLRDILELRNRELDAVISINRAELEMSKSMEISNNQIRARVYEHLAQQKTLNESIADGIIRTFETAADQAGKALDRLNEKTKGFLSFIIEPAKAIQRNILSNITKNIIDAVFPGMGDQLTKTSNPIARPIVDEQQKTNKILERIAQAVGAGKGVGNVGSLIPGLGGSIGNNGLGTIFGGNAGGGIFNFGGSGNYGTRTGDIVDGAMQIFAGDKGRDNIFSNLKNFFSGKKGGIFGKEGFGNNVGTYSTIGMGASILSSIIGGRAGGFLSNIGSGVAMGAQIGSIIPGFGTVAGAIIGGGIGLISSILGGDKNRKQDKKENMPALQKGLTDSFTQFQQLLTDLKSLRIDGGSAITKARELRSDIANSFGINFLSKKYKKESQRLISLKLAEIDRRNEQDPLQGGLMQQIEYYAELAKGAETRNKRIVAEFATGAYISPQFKAQYSDFKKRNGMLSGSWTGRDELLSVLAKGEMVLNPSQIRQVIQNARYSQGDPFRGANIPGYANGVYVSPSPSPSTPTAISGNTQPIIVQNNLTLVVEEGTTFDEKTKAYLISDSGKRVQIDIQKELKKEGRI